MTLHTCRNWTPVAVLFAPSLLILGCGGGGSSSGTTTPPVQQTTTTQVSTLTQNFVTSSAFLPLPGAPMVIANGGPLPPLMVPAAAASACPNVTVNGTTVTADFSACPNMSGSITMTYSVDGTGAYSSTSTYNNFSYHFGSNSGSLNGSLTMSGTTLVSGSSFGFHILTTGLNGSTTYNGVTQTWSETMDISISLTVSGTAMTLQEYGAIGFTGGFGTFSGTIPAATPLTWNMSSCHYPTSGTINWSAAGTSASATFGPACGAYTVNGQAFTLGQ
jgi:hypothetical protein